MTVLAEPGGASERDAAFAFPPGNRKSVKRSRLGVDWAGLAVILFAGLNLNAVILMISGAKSALSLPMLAVVAFLFYRRFRFSTVADVHLLFTAFIASYLAFGAISNFSAPESSRIAVTYATTLQIGRAHV